MDESIAERGWGGVNRQLCVVVMILVVLVNPCDCTTMDATTEELLAA